MREIIFRSWDLEQKMMRKCAESFEMLMRQSLYNQGGIGGFNYDSNIIWMQYTGCRDASNIMVFEGDILELSVGEINNKYRYIVSFEDGAFVGYHTKLKDGFGNPQKWGELSRFKLKELLVYVIGNIYENPELLN